MPGLQAKAVLKRLAARRLPPELLSLPKHGFTAPVGEWVTRQYAETFTSEVLSPSAFVGGLVDGKMVLSGLWKGVLGPGKDALIRMTYSKNADGSVRQHGEQSTDAGKTWSTNFDFTYHPKKAPTP